MCRLFGYASGRPGNLAHPLLKAENSIARQSVAHRDGWGVGWFQDEEARVRKRTDPAFADRAFRHTTRHVRSTHVVAHVRDATWGRRVIHNNHPFQHGGWLFAHNGSVEAFHRVRERLLSRVHPDLRASIRGETDSEVLFHLLLTDLLETNGTVEVDVAEAAPAAARLLLRIAELDEERGSDPSTINLLLTNGRGFVATRRGRPLAIHAPEARPLVALASEPPDDEPWDPVPEGSIVVAGPRRDPEITSLRTAR